MSTAAIAVTAVGLVGVAAIDSPAIAETPQSTTGVTTKTAATTKLTKAQQLKAKYGIYPLPVSEKTIKRYHLSNKELKNIKQAQAFANTRKARAVRRCESNHNYKLVDGAYHGAWQFDSGTWKGNGGRRFGRQADKAPRWAQDYVMWKTWKKRGWGPWSCA